VIHTTYSIESCGARSFYCIIILFFALYEAHCFDVHHISVSVAHHMTILRLASLTYGVWCDEGEVQVECNFIEHVRIE